ncbi:MAG: glycoside hydrolase family 97 protein [Melioribacter sp.]|nr:glycoside hydrolase family 97 protein [Melioribacter sp.]
MKKLFFILWILIFYNQFFAKEFIVQSPNKSLEMRIGISNIITYSISKDGKQIIAPSQISLKLSNDLILGKNPIVINSKKQIINQVLKPIVKQKFKDIVDNYNELVLDFKNNYSLVLRVYNDGAAYRFRTYFKDDITVYSEQFEVNFFDDHKIHFPEEDSFMSHSERLYRYINLSEINSKRFCSLPAVIEIDDKIKCAITEADLEDYPGMYLKGSDDSKFKLQGLFPNYPIKEEAKNDRDIYVVERADYLVKTKGTRDFPWRVFVITDNDAQLIESTIIYKLAKPHPQEMDFSWVRPGKVAWDWWNANNIYGVDFRAGINTQTYKYYIDFASKYGIEYVILDEGWYEPGNLFKINPEINIEEIVEYARQKNVGIILWTIWKTLDEQFEKAMNQFEKWGIKGIKVDFMQRDDAWMVNYYYKVAKEAAKRKFLVDFHGAYKPTGLYRTFPNVITSEGVLGAEHNKWSNNVTPEHTLTIPFIRMLAGPMDFTPGAMKNATKENFRIIFTEPMSQGTRCHQLAMYIVYESPLQMLADSPTNYMKEKECIEFLSKVPTVWDYTKVLDSKISEYVLIARKSGNKWYVGAMTNWTPRKLTVDFSFLEENKNYNVTIYQDGVNADRNANDYKSFTTTITRDTKLEIQLAPGGGWVAVVE